ncbi:MAG: tetratricopeptide repeat protein [Bryobacterales bacterium]
MLESAVKEYPKYAAAWNMLGDMRMQLGLQDQALAAYENAVSADPQFILPYPGLLRLVAATGDMERAAAIGKKALELNPNMDDVRFYMCAAQLRAGQNENAAATASQMIERAPPRGFRRPISFGERRWRTCGSSSPRQRTSASSSSSTRTLRQRRRSGRR